MPRRFLALALSLAVAHIAWLAPVPVLAEPPPAKPALRDVTIDVTLEAPAGTPISGIPIHTSSWTVADAKRTDSSGHAVLSGQLPEDVDVARVIILPVTDVRTLYPGRDADIIRYNEVVASWSFQYYYTVPLTSGVTSYTLTIIGQPAVKVSGTVLLPNVASGGLKSVSVTHSVHPIGVEASEESGHFELGGCRKDQATTLFVSSAQDERILPIHLTAAQMAADIDLGEITVPPILTGGRRVRVTVSRMEETRSGPKRVTSAQFAVLVVSRDGSGVFGGGIGRVGVVAKVNPRPNQPLLELQPGEYFVCPGILCATDEATRLYELLHAGRAAEVEAAGVPKLVVPNDGSTDVVDFTIDCVAATAAVNAVPEAKPEQP